MAQTSRVGRRLVVDRQVVALTDVLEPRRLLCGTPHPLPAASSPMELSRPAIVLEHIPLSKYLLLSPEEQAAIDPHLIEDDRPEDVQLAPIREALAARSPANELPDALPDMVPLVGGSGGYLQPYIDKTEQPGRNLLRFSTAIGNIGDGPVILTSSNADINPDGTQRVTQAIYARQGNQFVLKRTRVGGSFIWHPGHGHFHYEGYADYRLLHSVNGQPGDIVMRADGTPAVGDKVGFCLINISSSFTMPGTNTSSSTLPNFNLAGQPSVSCGFLQGLHVGKADVYSSIYDGQWIDVTGVPNGQYFLEVTIDGSDTVLEKDENNNTVRVPITLNTSDATGGIAPDRFESPVPNNSFAAAVNLGEMGYQTQSGLTIHANYDDDFFRFTAASSGSGTIRTRAAHGDVNLFLYDAAGDLLRAASNQGSGTSANPETETVTWNLVEGETYYVRASGLGTGTTNYSGLSNNYALEFQIRPTVGVLAGKLKAEEGMTIPVTFVRNGPISGPITLRLSVSGTATPGVDYAALPPTVTIGNEALTYDLPVTIFSDALLEGTETLVITLLPDPLYVLGDAIVTTLTIADTTALYGPRGMRPPPPPPPGGGSTGRATPIPPPPGNREQRPGGALAELFSDQPVLTELPVLDFQRG